MSPTPLDSTNIDPVYAEAVQRFERLYQEVKSLDVNEPDAMTLATCSRDGTPTARIVLLRGFDRRGFVFYTNATSRKGGQLQDNPRAALCLYWDALGKQVRVEGRVQRVADEESDAYWSRRPRRSQIASAASLQSQPLDRRATYEARVAELEEKLADQDVPRPDHWYGFRVAPQRIEFWSNVSNRMHERTIYEQRGESWEKYLLYP